MVDLVYGRGITDIVREIPLYFGIFEKYVDLFDDAGEQVDVFIALTRSKL
jgi:hypothetical protein